MTWRLSTARGIGAVLAIAASLPTGACGAAPGPVTPGNVGQAIGSAHDGDVLVLGPGTYTGINLRDRHFAKPLVIDARAATITGVRLRNTVGVTIRGGTFHLPPEAAARDAEKRGDGGRAISIEGSKRIKVENATFLGPGAASADPNGAWGQGTAIKVMDSSDIEIRDNRLQGFRRGVSFAKSQDFVVAGNTFQWMRSDGINVALSRKGLVEDNHCSNTRVRDAEHPDCVQLWSRPEAPPTADIVIRGNHAEGPTQGIGAFNAVRKGIDDGGFDRITIENNVIDVSRPNGITLNDARSSVVRNNRVTTSAGAKWQAKIRLDGDIVRCGNTVAGWGGKPAENDRAC
jgi:hypothetical protein